MVRYANTVIDQYETPVPGAQITVLDADGELVPLTTDAGANLLNPVATDTLGAYYFNAPEGTYTLQYRLSPLRSPFRVEEVVLDLDSSAILAHTFRKAIHADDTLAAIDAAATGYPVRFVAGMGSGSGGKYILDNVPLPAGTHIFGDGPGKTVIEWVNGTALLVGMFSALGASNVLPVKKITIRDLTLQDDVAARGFLENHDMLYLCGVEDLLIENVHFLGFRSDAIHLAGEVGTPSVAGDYRHNKNVTIRNCRFDGVNNNNRNPITIIDATNVLIENCKFENCTKPGGGVALDPMNPNSGTGMPGAIDLEPNPYSGYILRNITVRDCSFDNVTGNLGAITLFVPDAVTGDVGRFAFINNRVRNSYRDFYIRKGATTPSASTPSLDIVIDQHKGSGGTLPFAFVTGRGIEVTDTCSFRDYTGSAWIGYTDSPDNAYWRVRDVRIAAEFERCASGGGNAISFYKGDYVNFEGARFLACGNGGTNDGAIGLLSGSSTNVSLKNCVARDLGGKTIKAVYVAGAHTLSASTNRQRDNQWSGLTNEFVANRSDVPQSFVPSITGFSNGSAVTISANDSYYWVDGVQLFIDSVVQWSNNGGATGASVFRLPDLGAFPVSTPGSFRDTSLSVTASGTGGTLTANERLVGRFTNAYGFPAVILQKLNTTTGVYSDFVAASSATTLSVSGSMLLTQG